MAVSAGLMVVGAVAPWVRVMYVSVSGVDAGEGWVVIAAAALAGAMLYVAAQRRDSWPPLVSAGAGLLGLAVAAVDAIELARGTYHPLGVFLRDDAVSPGWGLFLVAVASAGVVAASLLLYADARRSAAATPQATSSAQSPYSAV